MKPYLFLFLFLSSCFAEDFILVNDQTNEVVIQTTDCDVRTSPCSTFKIVLSLMGYDSNILIDEDHPKWPYSGQDCFLDVWKQNQTPKSWMQESVLWYSQELSPQIGLSKIEKYLAAFDYGNQDFTGGLTTAWLSSTLQISPLEQIAFLKKIVDHSLSVSDHALTMTKNILYTEEFEGWKLFGKTGSSITQSIAWYVGWIEKNNQIYLFALRINQFSTLPTKQERIARVKQLIHQAGII